MVKKSNSENPPRHEPSVAGGDLDRVVDNVIEKLLDGEMVDEQALFAAHPDLEPRLRVLLPLLHDLDNGLKAFAGKSPPSAYPSGTIIGDFRLIDEIGRGGWGIVYRAEQISLQRAVALKMMIKGPGLGLSEERFQREARIAANLHHANIAEVYASGIYEGSPYFAAEMLEGCSCAEFVGRRLCGPGLDPGAPQNGDALRSLFEMEIDAPDYWALICERVSGAAGALAYAHQSQVIHRDIKPSNLFLTSDGRMVVLDFGFACRTHEHGLTLSGEVLGTPEYMSPEQASGDSTSIDQRTDIYSLGASLYELLSLRRPYSGDNPLAVIRKIAGGPPPRLRSLCPWIPRELEAVVEKAMARSLEDRYRSAAELADDLIAVASGPSFQELWAARTPPRKSAPKKVKHRLVAAATLVVLLGLVSILIAYGSDLLPLLRPESITIHAPTERLDLQSLNHHRSLTLLSCHPSFVPDGAYALRRRGIEHDLIFRDCRLLKGGDASGRDHFILHLNSYVLLKLDTGRSNYASPVIHDFDADGFPEIVGCTRENGSLYIFNLKGDLVYKELAAPSDAVTAYSSPVLADIDGDGELEIIVAYNRKWSGAVAAFEVSCGEEGRFRITNCPTFERRELGAFTQSVPAVGDIDNDGKLEIVISARGGWVFSIANDGTKEWQYSVCDDASKQDEFSVNSPMIFDLDGDGFQEVIVATRDYSKPNTEVSKLLILKGRPESGKGNERRQRFWIREDGKAEDWIRDHRSADELPLEGGCRAHPEFIDGRVMPDLDGHKTTMWLFMGEQRSIRVVKIETIESKIVVHQSYPTDTNTKWVWCRPALYDADDDNIPEVFYVCDGGSIGLLQYNRSNGDFRQPRGGPVFVDAIGTDRETPLTGVAVMGSREKDRVKVVFGTAQDRESCICITEFRKEATATSPVLTWLGAERTARIGVGGNVYAHIAVDDLNNDGQLEAVVPCEDGYVYVIALPRPGYVHPVLWSNLSFPFDIISRPVSVQAMNAEEKADRIAFVYRDLEDHTVYLSAWQAARDYEGGCFCWLAHEAWRQAIDMQSPALSLIVDKKGDPIDIDGDGMLDLAVTESSRTAFRSGANGQELVEPGVSWDLASQDPERLYEALLLDIDGDGCDDRVTINKFGRVIGCRGDGGTNRDGANAGDDSVIWYWRAGTREDVHGTAPFHFTGRQIAAFELIDWDGDGEQEILAAWEGGLVWILKPRARHPDSDLPDRELFPSSLTQRPYHR